LSPIRIRSYDDLLRVMRSAAVALETTRVELDFQTQFAGGYSGKVLCDPPIRKLTWDTAPIFLDALGLVLVVMPDNDAIRELRRRYRRKRNFTERERAALLSI